MTEDILISISDELSGQRLDKCLSQLLPDLSRSRLQALIAAGALTCKGQPITDGATKVKPGEYRLSIPQAAPSHLVAQDIPLEIIFEDEHLLVINKPAGLTVHPAPGHADGTLVNALLAHCGASLSGIGGVARPGIVHRIDKDTSGLMVVAKHDAAHVHLSAQLSDHSLARVYNAVVWGAPPNVHFTVTGNIGRSPANRQKMAVVKGGKPATTHVTRLEIFHPATLKSPLASLIECRLETGRTHQIRVHMAHSGHPLLGDPQYGQATSARLHGGPYKNLPDDARAALLGFTRQALHARELGLIHPATNTPMRFTCALPADMQNLLAALRQA